MELAQPFKCKKNLSIPSWYEESIFLKTTPKNQNNLCLRTSEGKKTYLEADFEVSNIELASATI